MDRKKKLFLLIMIFKVFFKNKWKRRRLKLKRLQQNIRQNSILNRRKMSCFYFSNLINCMDILPKTRSVWERDREEFWFENMWENRHNHDMQLQRRLDFRMNGENFEKLVDIVRPRLEKQDTQLRKAIPVEKRVAVALWRLSTGNSFRTVSKTFAIGKSSAVSIKREFCSEIFRLSADFIKFPISQLDTAKAIETFKQECDCKIPQVLGAIDGTHIFIQTPENDQKYDYFG